MLIYYTIPTERRYGQDKSENGLCLLSPPHWRVLKNGDPHFWCYMQLQWPNSTLRYTIFSRKITSYIYLLIFTISLWLHVKHFIALTKRESVRRIFFCCNYWSGLSLSTHRPMTKKTKACVCIKRVKTDSYLTYGHSRKTWNIRRYPHLQINSFVLWKCNMGWEY
jgi:hypothetical protein